MHVFTHIHREAHTLHTNTKHTYGHTKTHKRERKHTIASAKAAVGACSSGSRKNEMWSRLLDHVRTEEAKSIPHWMADSSELNAVRWKVDRGSAPHFQQGTRVIPLCSGTRPNTLTHARSPSLTRAPPPNEATCQSEMVELRWVNIAVLLHIVRASLSYWVTTSGLCTRMRGIP